MLTPLLSIVFLLVALPAWAAPCPVPYVAETPARPEFEAGSKVCAYAVSLRPVFDKLRAAAGVGELRLLLSPSGEYNAYFEPGRVVINHGALANARTLEEIPFVLAHEIGHAVQYEGPEQVEVLRQIDAFKPTQEGVAVFNLFGRRHEAQADAIAMELLIKIGHTANVARRGVEGFTKCSFADGLEPNPRSGHPSHAQRIVNASVGQRFFADASRRARVNNGKDFFAAAGSPEPVPGASVAVPLRPRPVGAYTPTAKLADFHPDGGINLNRLASRSQRTVEPPPIDQSPASESAQPFFHINLDRYLTVAVLASANRLASHNELVDAILIACGTSRAEPLVKNLELATWSRRAAVSVTPATSVAKK